MRLYLDTESIGLVGPLKLIQYSIDRGPVQFIKLPAGWRDDADTRERLTALLRHVVNEETVFVGWNIAHDLFHMYRLAAQLEAKRLENAHYRVKNILLPEGRWPFPFKCKTLDLYLHACLTGPLAPFAFAKRGSGGTGKKVAGIRRVPKSAAEVVRARVEQRLAPMVPGTLSCHYHEIEKRPDLVSLSWTVDVSMSLKAHAALWGEPVLKLADVWPLPPKKSEREWLADDLSNPVYAQLEPECDRILADDSSPFYEYARKDIEYLWLAEDKLGNPEPDHHDTAAHVVAYTRYYGFPLDRDSLARTEQHYRQKLTAIEGQLAGCDLKSSVQRKALLQKYDPIIQSTNKKVLTAITKIEGHPAQGVAAAMLGFGSASQKLKQTVKAGQSADGRGHPSLRVLGTATGRMSGTSGINWQGVGKTETDANGYEVGLRHALKAVAVGDFAQFELCIGAAAWNVTEMLADLDAGVDIHLKSALACHPRLRPLNLAYSEAVKAYKNKDHDLNQIVTSARGKTKQAVVFAQFYGATEHKVAEDLGVEVEEGKQIQGYFFGLYPSVLTTKKKIESRFCTADTSSWYRDSVANMASSETDLTGFTRRWDFEKAVASVMWDLGNSQIETGVGGMIVRQEHKGPQSINQACRSALLGAAIAIQQAVFRQAANARIQATGANLCKRLQAELWDRFHIPMMNIHDEIVFADHPNFDYPKIQGHVADFVARHKGIVPHLAFDLKETVRWADK